MSPLEDIDQLPLAEDDKTLPLNERQIRFCEEYMASGNGTKSAIRAGYSATGASVHASALLRNRRIIAELTRRRSVISQRLEITAERIIEELAKIGFANVLDYAELQADGTLVPDFSLLDRDGAAAIQEFSVDEWSKKSDGIPVESEDEPSGSRVRRTRIKLHDKRQALLDIGKHLGMFADRKIVTGLNGGPIGVQLEDARASLLAALVTAGVADATPAGDQSAPAGDGSDAP